MESPLTAVQPGPGCRKKQGYAEEQQFKVIVCSPQNGLRLLMDVHKLGDRFHEKLLASLSAPHLKQEDY